ncbi:MAG: hypothetical protein U0984_15285 [Prosthecobacter sp.]|nr:hypothetical protein [Prosthecobacter sp.]
MAVIECIVKVTSASTAARFTPEYVEARSGFMERLGEDLAEALERANEEATGKKA